MHQHTKRKGGREINWPAHDKSKLLFDLSFWGEWIHYLGDRAAWIISPADFPLPTSPPLYGHPEIMCLYQILASAHSSLGIMCILNSLSPALYPGERERSKELGRMWKSRKIWQRTGVDGVALQDAALGRDKFTLLRCGAGRGACRICSALCSSQLPLVTGGCSSSLLKSQSRTTLCTAF